MVEAPNLASLWSPKNCWDWTLQSELEMASSGRPVLGVEFFDATHGRSSKLGIALDSQKLGIQTLRNGLEMARSGRPVLGVKFFDATYGRSSKFGIALESQKLLGLDASKWT